MLFSDPVVVILSMANLDFFIHLDEPGHPERKIVRLHELRVRLDGFRALVKLRVWEMPGARGIGPASRTKQGKKDRHKKVGSSGQPRP